MQETAIEPLYGKNPTQLQEICAAEGLPRFAAKQIARHLYVRRATDFGQMTDLALAARARLAEKYAVGAEAPLRETVSADGTKKYLFRTSRGAFIESAFIPDGERATLCVSSQAGCRMGCRFCATGRQGLQHSLSASEIVNQILSVPESASLTNLVFMGMGEPLDNTDNLLAAIETVTAPWGMAWSPTRITVSTADDGSAECLTFIMPIENAYPIREVADILRRYDFTGQRRVSFEYILMEGLNDTPAHIKELCRLLDGIKCRINLIRFHKIPDSPYFSPSEERMRAFRDTLTARGIQTTIRASRGEDIQAACGLLSTIEKRRADTAL